MPWPVTVFILTASALLLVLIVVMLTMLWDIFR